MVYDFALWCVGNRLGGIYGRQAGYTERCKGTVPDSYTRTPHACAWIDKVVGRYMPHVYGRRAEWCAVQDYLEEFPYECK